jgi:hypothetical protein
MPSAAEIAAARALAASASGPSAARIDALTTLRVQADDLLGRLAGLLAETC